MDDLTQRLEEAIFQRPQRWIVVRDKNTGQLLQAWDKDTGRLWTRINNSWIWID